MGRKTIKSAILYIRTSTTDQKNSIENQKADLREYCSQHSIEIIAEYVDFGISGKNTYERPEFTKLMNSIKSSDIALADVVLCTKLDRFARSMRDLLNCIEEITKKGMRFSTLDQDFETDTHIGKLIFNIMGSFAEFERGLINERTREGYRAALLKGEKVCHRPKAEIPKKKVLEYVNMGLSTHVIAKLINPTLQDGKKKGALSANTIKNRLNEWGYIYENGRWIKVEKEL